MIKTLRESKAKLSALVECAAAGEEVIITVRGKPKARLCPLRDTSYDQPASKKTWGRKLHEARAKYSVSETDSGADIIDDLRGSRA